MSYFYWRDVVAKPGIAQPLDINECSANNGGCSVNAQCTNVIGGPRICTCNAGYTGDGITCAGIVLVYLKFILATCYRK